MHVAAMKKLAEVHGVVLRNNELTVKHEVTQSYWQEVVSVTIFCQLHPGTFKELLSCLSRHLYFAVKVLYGRFAWALRKFKNVCTLACTRLCKLPIFT